MVKEKRLFVVPVVAYVILGVLGVTALLNICLFYSAKQESMLREEPFSLISYAGILHKSEDIKAIMTNIVDRHRDPRRARETAKTMYRVEDTKWMYDTKSGKIIMTHGQLKMHQLSAAGESGNNFGQFLPNIKRDAAPTTSPCRGANQLRNSINSARQIRELTSALIHSVQSNSFDDSWERTDVQKE